jgi:hypothetical protein
MCNQFEEQELELLPEFNIENEYLQYENNAKGSGKVLIILIVAKNGQLISTGDVRYSIDIYDNSENRIQTYPDYVVGNASAIQAISFDYNAASIQHSVKVIVEPKKTAGYFLRLRMLELINLPKESADVILDTFKLYQSSYRSPLKKKIQYLLKAIRPSLDYSFIGGLVYTDIGTGQAGTIPNSQLTQKTYLKNRS